MKFFCVQNEVSMCPGVIDTYIEADSELQARDLARDAHQSADGELYVTNIVDVTEVALVPNDRLYYSKDGWKAPEGYPYL